MKIIGHRKQQIFLEKIIKSGNIPHALLFSGPDGVGKKTLALNFISLLFKEKLTNHPDFILVFPQSKTDLNKEDSNKKKSVRQQIQIEQIRNLNWRLSLRPIRAPLLAVVIDQAHTMTREAQNCFLKTLEEPKTNSVLILISENPSFLLPTIISRCEQIKFHQVDKKEILDCLNLDKSVNQEDLAEIVEASLGRPGKAIDFLETPQKIKLRKDSIKKLLQLLKSPLSLRFQYAKDLSQNEDLKDVLSAWLFYFRKELILSKSNNILDIKKNLETIQATIYLLNKTNVNTRLALEVMLMRI